MQLLLSWLHKNRITHVYMGTKLFYTNLRYNLALNYLNQSAILQFIISCVKKSRNLYNHTLMDLFRKSDKIYFYICLDDKVALFYYVISNNCNCSWYKVYGCKNQNSASFYLYHCANKCILYAHADLNTNNGTFPRAWLSFE
jgi:hypothetical protein